MAETLLLDGPWELRRGDAGGWLPAVVPGTVAQALAAAGRWQPGEPDDFDDHDWTFRTRFTTTDHDRPVLYLDGIATHATVALNGAEVLRSESMFARHAVDVSGHLRAGENELVIRCLALSPLLAALRRPRARWRTRLVDNALRWHRTMLLGRAPGIAPSPAAVGPWRPVRLGGAAPPLRLEASVEGSDGVLRLRGGDGDVRLDGPSGTHRARLCDGEALRIPDVRRWWPHTHGEPVLHDVVVTTAHGTIARRVGFRTIRAGPGDFALSVNDVAVFARGAVWTPADPVSLCATEERLRAALTQVRDAHMNIVRVVGTAVYETAEFFDLCDELGLLVWQDFMFANLDYPIEDPGFRRLVEAEAETVLAEVASRASLAVLCGNSEVEQQVAMLGLDPQLGRGELFGELLPALCARLCPGVPYVPSAPSGGTLPFRFDTGVAHYFGVGGYRRPVADARMAGVRFAAEALAFSNLGDDDDHRRRGVPADNGAGWDFADVRDHYVRERYGVDPVLLAAEDPGRYVALGRQVTGEVMAEVFGEWRRDGSPCRGGIVLWLRDLAPGAGWGLIDDRGRPKAALGHLRRVLAPVAVWTTDEGLAGIAAHVANDTAAVLRGRLRCALYAHGEQLVGERTVPVEVAPRGAVSLDVEGVLGRFADVAWAYRFGPPAQDLVVCSLEDAAGREISSAFRFPAGPPIEPRDETELGLTVRRTPTSVELTARRVLYGVRLTAAGATFAHDAFCLEPGHRREIALPAGLREDATLTVTAVNLVGPIER